MGNALSRQLRALALVFDYPGEALQAYAAEIAQLLTPLQTDAQCSAHTLRTLLDHLRDTDLLELQAEYVDTFDRGRATSLNLFEQVHGDSRDRGQAMVDLLAQYRNAGLNLQTRQLPDYLPAYLEYCSVLELDAARGALEDIALLLAGLAAALDRRESPWVAAASALCRLAGEDDWRGAVEREPAAADPQSPTPGSRDVRREGLPADWTPAALDAAWAEEPVNFLGACSPQRPQDAVHVVQFHPRVRQPPPPKP